MDPMGLIGFDTQKSIFLNEGGQVTNLHGTPHGTPYGFGLPTETESSANHHRKVVIQRRPRRNWHPGWRLWDVLLVGT